MFNRQRKLPVDVRPLATFVSRALDMLGSSMGCAVVLVSDSAMARLNARFAGVDSPTDVLSFPTSEEERGWEPNLGDVFVSTESAERQRQDSFENELRILVLHGLPRRGVRQQRPAAGPDLGAELFVADQRQPGV